MEYHPQPTPGTARPWAFPAPERGALPNGLTVLRCHRPGQQVVAVEIFLDAPLEAEPEGLDGVATIMSRALSEGTDKHSAEEFAAELERCGATLDAHADHPGVRVSLEVPVSRLAKALGLVAEALRAPAFDASEIERLVGNRLDEIPHEHANPSRRAAKQLSKELFPATARMSRPRLGTEETVRRIDESAVRALFDARAAVHRDDRALGQLTGTGQSHHGRNAERPRQDRAVTGRPALLGDEAEHQRRVEERRVGRRQVPGDQDVRLVAVRHTGHRHTEQPRHDPVPHVVEVRDPTRQVLPGIGEQRPVRGERVVHGTLGGAAHGDTPVDIGHQLGVLRHHGLRLEHVLCLAAGQIAACDQVGRHGFHRLPGAPLFALGLLGGNRFGGRFQHRRAHVPNLADGHTVAHADASQRCLHFTRLRLCGDRVAAAVVQLARHCATGASLPAEQRVADLHVPVLTDIGERLGGGLQGHDRADG